jgi:Bacillus transposase protein.
MVIYNSGDSDNLIQALSANIKNAKEVFDKVKQGTQHLSSVIDSGTLSGSAYRAGQSLFQSYITPMIQKLDSAIDDIQGDLDSYKKAEQHVRALDSHLDEDYLKGMLNNTNQMIRLIEQKIAEDKRVMEKLANLHFDELVKGLQEIPGLEQQLDNMKQLKHDYEKKIQTLQTFASSTNSLFTDSLQAFKYALQGVDIINQSKASVDGTITFPAGSNMNWLKALNNQTLDYGIKQPDYSKIGKGLEDLDKLKQAGAMSSAYFGKTGKDKNSHKLKDLTVKKIISDYGSIELVKITSENSILSGKQDIVSNTKKKFGSDEILKKVHIGNIWGGSSTLLAWEPPKNIPIVSWFSSVNLGKQNLGYYADFKPGNTNVGFSAQEVFAEASTKQLSFKLPIIGNKVTIGFSGSFSAGGSGHLTTSKESGLSAGFSFGVGPGLGINLKVK